MHKCGIKTLILFACISVSIKSAGQDFYLLDSYGKVNYSSISGGCSSTVLSLSCQLYAGDIAYYKDTLYFIAGNNLYKSIVSNSSVPCKLVISFPYSLNALTADSAGTLYGAGGNQIYSYKPSTGIVTFLGSIPSQYSSAGDFTFYNGKLYLCATAYSNNTSRSCLLEINMQQPSSSVLFMNLTTPNVYGAITLPETCDSTGFYITSFSNSGSDLIKIDMINKVELGIKCHYNFSVFGAASILEGGGHVKPVIENITINSACSNDGSNGYLKVSVNNSGSVLTYYLNNSVSNQTGVFTNLKPGNYNIRIANEFNCSVDTNITLPSVFSSVAVNGINPKCTSTNGEIIVKAFPDSVGWLYSLNGSPFKNIDTFKNLSAGTYTIKAVNLFGCVFDTSIVLKVSIPQIDSIKLTNFCANEGNKGAVKVFGKNTGDTLYYTINNITNNTGVFLNLSAGTFVCRVSNQLGCYIDTSINIQSISPPAFRLSSINPTCLPNSGKIIITPQANDATLKYSLNGGAFYIIDTVKNLSAGVYVVTVINADGCAINDSISLVLPVINVSGINIQSQQPTCELSNGSIETKIQNLTAPVSFNLNGINNSTGKFYNLNSGAYHLSITDGNFCSFDTLINLHSNIILKPLVQIATTAASCPGKLDGSISLTISGSQSPYLVSFNNLPYSSGFTYMNIAAGRYEIIIANNERCHVDSFEVELNIKSGGNCNSVYFPNAFTPNGDRRNDLFKPVIFGVLEKYELMIYDRYGQKVFESTDYNEGWNGVINGILPGTQTFIWISKYKFFGELKENIQKGTIVLIK